LDKALELAAAGGLAAEATTPAPVAGTPATPAHTHAACLNCGAHLHGRFCHDCGQSADDHHRSIGHLLWEAVEGFTHLDGRLAKTLPPLLIHPGRLARDQIEGRRQRHVPPFRLFLISLLIFMFSAELLLGHGGDHPAAVHKTHTVARSTYQVGGQKVVVVRSSDVNAALNQAAPHDALGRWLKEHIGRAVSNREYFLMLVFEWMHRLAVLLLPILAGLLTVVYVYKKQFYVYDHLVVAMQYLSFCFLVWGAVWFLPDPVQSWLFLPAVAWTPFNLYLILRAAYGSSRLGAAVKALALWSATVTVFALLLTALLAWTLDRM
jgi:hypothetical protein